MSIEQVVVIGSKAGLHARPASLIVKEASRFQSQLEIVTPKRQVNLKSLISVMSLGLKYGDSATLRATGPDEAEAVAHLVSMLEQELD